LERSCARRSDDTDAPSRVASDSLAAGSALMLPPFPLLNDCHLRLVNAYAYSLVTHRTLVSRPLSRLSDVHSSGDGHPQSYRAALLVARPLTPHEPVATSRGEAVVRFWRSRSPGGGVDWSVESGEHGSSPWANRVRRTQSASAKRADTATTGTSDAPGDDTGAVVFGRGSLHVFTGLPPTSYSLI
jgi:hypothetical protein